MSNSVCLIIDKCARELSVGILFLPIFHTFSVNSHNIFSQLICVWYKCLFLT